MPALDGKVAVVTGAARAGGLGRACAVGLASEGCRVAVTDIGGGIEDAPEYTGLGTRREIDETAREIVAAGGEAIGLPMDVRSEESVAGAFARIRDELGSIDILVNNAGVRFAEPALETTRVHWDVTMSVNAWGVFLCSREAARQMIDSGKGGRIVNIGSIAGARAMRDRAAYCASKWAVVGLTQALALEFGGRGITVNAVSPGRVDSGLAEPTWQAAADAWGVSLQEAKDRIGRQHVPLGRLLRTEEVSATVTFLCSPEAGAINGQVINVSGGEEVQLAELQEREEP